MVEEKWINNTFYSLQSVVQDDAVFLISFYEGPASASWKAMRLPTEAEWEVTYDHFERGSPWERTNSAYLLYPGFKKEADPLSQYSGKLMVNKMALFGTSEANSEYHSRNNQPKFLADHPEMAFYKYTTYSIMCL